MCVPQRRPVTRRGVLTGLGGLGLLASASACAIEPDSPAVTASSVAPPAPPGAADAGAADAGAAAPTSPSAAPTTGDATAAQLASRATVPVLCYHQVRDYTGDDSSYTRDYLVIPPAQLAVQLDAIGEAGYTPISPNEYDTHLQTGQGLPAKPVLLTFDDGKDNQVGAALPALTQRKMTATFFLMTVVLGNPGWIGRSDVKKLADAGMTVGSHTWDHHMVTKYSGDDFKTQFDDSRATLRRLSGQEVLDFAYPHGAWNPAALPHLRDAGYRAAYQLTDQPLLASDPSYTLRRLLTVSSWTGPEVVAKLESFAA